MRLGKKLFFLSLCLFVLTVPTSGGAADTGEEIRRLLNEAPPLASFPEAPGMIWKRQLHYRMLADGSLEKTTRWFILSGGDLPGSRRRWDLAVPEGGSIDVLESGIFDPLTGRLVSPLLPEDVEVDGLEAKLIRAPELGEEKLICVAFREVIPGRYNVDDFVWTAFELPCWEQDIVVEVPEDAGFSWEGRDVPGPAMEEGQGLRRYTWTLVNRSPRGKPTLAIPRRPYLSFSLKRGVRSSLDDLRASTGTLSCRVPAGLSRYLRHDATLKQVRRFLKALDAPERRMEELPSRIVRSGAALSGAKSWTEWERTLLAGRWLASAGVEVRTFWLPRVPQNEDDPASPQSWSGPVLQIKPRGSSAFYWSAGQRRSAGAQAFSLFGRRLYSVRNGSVESVKVPSGDVEEHRLILDWDLALGEGGFLEGILTVHVRGGWMELLGNPADGIEALRNMVDMPSLPQFAAGRPDVATTPESARFEFSVSCNAGIPSGAGALLLRLPSAAFPALNVKGHSGGEGLALRFPFVVDQRYNIQLPERYRLVAEPRLAARESGKIRFEEELRDRAKGTRLEGSFRMVVTERDLDAARSRLFVDVAGRVAQWGKLTVPLKK